MYGKIYNQKKSQLWREFQINKKTTRTETVLIQEGSETSLCSQSEGQHVETENRSGKAYCVVSMV